MDKILLVGDDFRLLASRAAILSKVTAKVTCCTSSEFARHVKHDDFGLVVLCHSLAGDARLSIVKETHRRWPKAGVLQVAPFYDPSSVPSDVDAVTSAEPSKLLERVSELLKLDRAP